MKNLIKNATLILCALILNLVTSHSSFAQDESKTSMEVGVRGGFNFHKMSGSDTKRDVGISFGIWGADKFSKRFGWRAELLYLEQGGMRNINISIFDFTTEFNIDYISLPVMLTVHPFDFLSFQAGIQPGFTVNKEVVTTDFIGPGGVDKINDISSFDAAALIGMEVKVPYWGGNWAFTARLRRGLTNIYTGSEDATIKNRGFALSATYTVPLSDLLN